MKLQPASKKEVIRIAVGSSICAVAEIVVFLILSLLGVGSFGFPVVIGTLGGTLIAICNFTLMCLMVQSAAATQDEKLRRAKVQGSYNLRLFIQAGWVVAAFLIPFIQVIAAAIPLLFPTAVIYYLQITGKLLPKSETPAAPRQIIEEDGEENEDNLNSFEV